jgi:hypothetical protein
MTNTNNINRNKRKIKTYDETKDEQNNNRQE